MNDFPLCLHQEQQLAREELRRSRQLQAAANNYVDAVIWTGTLDVTRLSDAFARLVRRHSVLRSTLRTRYGLSGVARSFQLNSFARTGICEPGMYIQTIHGGVRSRIRTVRADAVADAEATLRRLILEEAITPFDYTVPPLFRCTCVETDRERHWVILSVPQIIFDAASLDLLWNELFEAYAVSHPAPGGPSAPQHHEFAEWQRAQCATDYFSEAARFWEQEWSAGAQEHQSEPRRPAIRPTRPVRRELEIDGPAAIAVQRVCDQANVAPSVVFLTAFATTLRHAASLDTVRIWIECHNRQRDETEGMIGSIMNRHAISLHRLSAATGADYLECGRSRIVEALRYQEVSLAVLSRMVGRRYHPAGPGFAFTWRSAKPLPKQHDLSVERVLQPNTATPGLFAVSLTVLERGDSFGVVITDSLFGSTPRPMAARFRDVLERLVMKPDTTADCT